MTKPKKKRGVPIGYQHNWKYDGHWRERKIRPGEWEFTYSARKTRKGSPKGGLKPGQSVVWDVKGTQTATKVSGRTYKTRLKGTKKFRKIIP